jgi:hypothetical protein
MIRAPQNIAARITATYDRTTHADRVEIRKPGTYGEERMGHWKTEHQATLRADFDIEINVEAITKQLILQAQRNKTGKAGAMGGLIKVKRRNVTQLRGESKQVPLPKGWSEVST